MPVHLFKYPLCPRCKVLQLNVLCLVFIIIFSKDRFGPLKDCINLGFQMSLVLLHSPFPRKRVFVRRQLYLRSVYILSFQKHKSFLIEQQDYLIF